MKNPTPVVTEQKCSLCGLDWNRHGDKPTALTCIALLKADLAVKPVVVPAPANPFRPYYPGPWPNDRTIWCSTQGSSTGTAYNTTEATASVLN